MLKFWKRKLDHQEPEVVRALITSALFIIIFLYIDFFNVFLNHLGDIRALILGLIGGLLSLLGFSITGIAIVISLFNAQDIKSIEALKRNSYRDILETFKHFAYDMVINITLFIITYVLMLTDIPIPGKFIFYVYVAVLTYLFLYILFYGWALLSNCIALSNLKKLISESIEEEKSKFDLLNELGLEQLVEIIYRSSRQKPKSFYEMLLKMIKSSALPQKNELAEYIVRRYLNN